MNSLAFYSHIFTLGYSRNLLIEHIILNMKLDGDILKKTQKPFSWTIGSQIVSLRTLVESEVLSLYHGLIQWVH